MQKPTLVIMAAGLGSRFGGFKQIVPIDNAGQIIMDYSIYDAMQVGFGSVILVIKPGTQREFHEAIGRRIAKIVPITYAEQRMDALPNGFTCPEGRDKPWGTAHAVLAAKAYVDGPFAAINADDFYGREAFSKLYDFLITPHAQNEHALVGYRIENTLTENGFVSRGVCSVRDGILTKIVERIHIVPCEGGAKYTDRDSEVFLPAGTYVSMNLWGFQRSMMDEIEERFSTFLEENLPKNPLKGEYYLPMVPDQLIQERRSTFRVLETSARWYGITYRQDLPAVQVAFEDMSQRGEYPKRLFD